MPFQDLRDGAAGKLVSQVGPCALDSPIAQSRFSSAIRSTQASISPAVRGRPDPRLLRPSYFCAISLRCQANKVSGVTMVAFSKHPPSYSFGLSG
jgi:hypothetical protein